MSSLKVFCVIVIYNGMRRDWIEKCFTSLITSDIAVDIIAIDNCSKDDSVSYVKKQFPSVTLIVSKENLGFAKANNIGIKMALEANADYIFLLNQDAWTVDKGDITSLIVASKAHPEYGILSPIVFEGSGKELEYSFNAYTAQSDYKYPRDAKRNDVVTVPFVNAAAWLIPRHCFEKVGGFDTRLFQHYGEDDNYSQRVSYCGLKTGIVTNSFVCHDTLSTGGVNPDFVDKMRWIELKVSITDVKLNRWQTLIRILKYTKILLPKLSQRSKRSSVLPLIWKMISLYFFILWNGKKTYYLS